MSAYALNPTLTEANFAFPFLALKILPTAVGLVVLIAGLSATMSSASSDAIAAVSILTKDMIPAKTKGHKAIQKSRLGLIVIISLALVCALFSNNIIDYIAKMISTVMTGLCVCGVLGRFWPRFTWAGALAALFFGSAAALTILSQSAWLAYWGNPVLPALIASCLSGIAVSLLTSVYADTLRSRKVI